MKWKVSHSEAGLRLSHFIQGKLETPVSQKSVKRSLEANQCLLNGTIERFASTKVKTGDIITFQPQESQAKHTFDPSRVLYEDEHFLFYNKPAALTSEPSGLPSLFPDYQLIHRLDRDTTGVILFAKSADAHKKTAKLFKHRNIHKEYLAIVDGVPKKNSGTIENHLGKVGWFEGQTIWGKLDTGLYAKTSWKIESKGKKSTLLRCFPLTGRTHQIRVHLKEMGHPILGDAQYARSFQCSYFPMRTLLHARKIRFVHPFTNKEIVVKAPIPEDFDTALKKMGLSCAS